MIEGFGQCAGEGWVFEDESGGEQAFGNGAGAGQQCFVGHLSKRQAEREGGRG